jgi:hypothetical protein
VLLIKQPKVTVSTQLELVNFSAATEDLNQKRPDITITNWPIQKSLRMIDLAITNPVSKSIVYSNDPLSVDPLRLLKKRELQKTNKYSTLVQSQGGEFSPLVIGTSGSITASTKRVLQVICSSQDITSPQFSYDYWMTKISFSLHKSIATEIISRSLLHNRRQFSPLNPREAFKDSVDIHLEMNG